MSTLWWQQCCHSLDTSVTTNNCPAWQAQIQEGYPQSQIFMQWEEIKKNKAVIANENPHNQWELPLWTSVALAVENPCGLPTSSLHRFWTAALAGVWPLHAANP